MSRPDVRRDTIPSAIPEPHPTSRTLAAGGNSDRVERPSGQTSMLYGHEMPDNLPPEDPRA